MQLRVVGAGLPRTGTSSLSHAFEHLLGGPCMHMRAIPTHPFQLGTGWDRALAGEATDWDALLDGYVAAVDWPASIFWRELSAANPDALVLLSVRDDPEVWLESLSKFILPHARMSQAPDWSEGLGLLRLFERFTGTSDWDDPDVLKAAYERHNAAVRASIPADRLLEWRATEGWVPICAVLNLPVPDLPFPWIR